MCIVVHFSGINNICIVLQFDQWRCLCRLRSIATHRDHFVRRMSVRLSHFSVTLSRAMFRRRHMHSSECCHYFIYECYGRCTVKYYSNEECNILYCSECTGKQSNTCCCGIVSKSESLETASGSESTQNLVFFESQNLRTDMKETSYLNIPMKFLITRIKKFTLLYVCVHPGIFCILSRTNSQWASGNELR